MTEPSPAPAPAGARTPSGPGRPCLELVATLHTRFGPEPHDDIADPGGLSDWLDRCGLLPAAAADSADTDAYLAVREAVFRLLGAVTGTAEEPRPSDVAVVNAHAHSRAPVVGLAIEQAGDGAAVLVRTSERATPAQVLVQLARDAIDLLTGPERDRLQQCEARPCGSYYLDTSRGRRRRWCSSASCGNRARVAAHRDRQRT